MIFFHFKLKSTRPIGMMRHHRRRHPSSLPPESLSTSGESDRVIELPSKLRAHLQTCRIEEEILRPTTLESFSLSLSLSLALLLIRALYLQYLCKWKNQGSLCERSSNFSERGKIEGRMDSFSSVSPTRVFWNSRKRSANRQNLDKATEGTPIKHEEPMVIESPQDSVATPVVLSERRKALFEPLEPTMNIHNSRPSAEVLLPPPDFDAASYPKGWLIGKKRKLVNVDVVESMRRIAVHEMNRKDREIDGLNEQLDEDARCLEHLQLQLLEERRKRADVERENAILQNEISMLMNMLQENERTDAEGTEDS